MAKQPATLNGIPVDEYSSRRETVLKSLKGAASIVFSGEGTAPLLGKWRPDFNFVYLTGLTDEPGAAVLFDPAADDPRARCILFLRPRDPEAERWDGYRESINSGLKDRTGFDKIHRTGLIPRFLTAAARRAKRLACLHPFSVYPAPVSPDLVVYRQLSERIPGIAIEDLSGLLPRLRSVKSKAEIALMRKAVEATAAGYDDAMAMIRPGVTEADIAHALEHGYITHGGTGIAYNSIVGTGLNSTVLHYMANSATVQDGDVICIDSAAEYCYYAADVTRTFPASGRFTAEQRKIYEIVLAAQLAAIKAARPGAPLFAPDMAARAVIEKAGYGDAFIHGAGHPLGLEVHDVTPDTPLAPGMVITIEPGIYLPDQRIGVRIEDDILITPKGSEVLSNSIPKTPDEVEQAMHRLRK